MSEHLTAAPVRRISLEQKIIRKDGTVEDRGIVAYSHVKRSCRLFYRIERVTKTLAPPLARWAQRRREHHERH